MNLGITRQWVFESVSPMGGARSTAWRDTLEGSDLAGEQRIAREAIQNSVDATLPGKKTDVLVWNKTLSDEEAVTFRNILGLDSPNSPAGRLGQLGLKDDNAFELIKAGRGPQVTIVEDRNTCGLGVDEKNGKDRFRELCLYLGQDTADVDGERGGSYGFGKTVYQASSDCRTFIVYSVFEPKPETRQAHARLFGCSSFVGHQLEDGTKYTGRAWFGVPGKEPGRETCEPIVDEEAHELAAGLGFMRRDASEFGASIMILGSDLDLDHFRKAAEDYWWPRLTSDQLSIDLWKDDAPIYSPEPSSRRDLAPYIRCYRLVEDSDLPIEDRERRPPLNAAKGMRRGVLALRALPPDDGESSDDPELDTRLRNTVALIRSGPRMVVQYLDTGGRQRGDFTGAFVSHPDSEHALHLSEPPSHDSWNPNTQRLRNAEPDSVSFVDGILNTIKRQARGFQREIVPPVDPPPVAGTRKLERLLAEVMSSKGRGPRTGRSSRRDPFEIRIHERRRDAVSKSCVVAKVEVKLRDDADIDQTAARMSIRPVVVLDDNKRRDDSEKLGLSSVWVDGSAIAVETNSQILLQLTKADAVIVEAESDPFDRDLSAELEILVERIETPAGIASEEPSEPAEDSPHDDEP